MAEIKVPVVAHNRKGTKGVKAHNRSIKTEISIPTRHRDNENIELSEEEYKGMSHLNRGLYDSIDTKEARAGFYKSTTDGEESTELLRESGRVANEKHPSKSDTERLAKRVKAYNKRAYEEQSLRNK